MRRAMLIMALVLTVTACTTVMGTNVPADRLVPSGSVVETLGQVSGSASAGHWLWAVQSDKKLYEEARRNALRPKDGRYLLNAKITTTLTSYLAIYYKTEIAIEGTAARLQPETPTAPTPSMPPKPPGGG